MMLRVSLINALLVTAIIGVLAGGLSCAGRLDSNTIYAIEAALSLTWIIFVMRWSLMPRCLKCGSNNLSLYFNETQGTGTFRPWYHCKRCKHRGAAPLT